MLIAMIAAINPIHPNSAAVRTSLLSCGANLLIIRFLQIAELNWLIRRLRHGGAVHLIRIDDATIFLESGLGGISLDR